MAKKRITLPGDFEELMEAGDLDALKAVFERCEVSAYGGVCKGTALSLSPLSSEFARWLVAQGADVNARDRYGRTPLHEQALDWRGNIDVLVELGADIEARDRRGATPLSRAAGAFRTEAVRALIGYGADAGARDDDDRTPLGSALANCQNANIVDAADVARALLDAGAERPADADKRVRAIGRSFEFYKEGFDGDFLVRTQAALQRLYRLFDVEPVPEVRRHDGVSPIVPTSVGWKRQHDELWDMLVPGSGAAKTVQGEAIRVTGRLAYEVLDNGCINWDGQHDLMADALLGYLGQGKPVGFLLRRKARSCVEALHARRAGAEEAYALCEIAVRWVLANPRPLALPKPAYRR